MTTYLNKATNSLFGIFPPEEDAVCILPCSALCGGYSSCGGLNNIQNASVARVLLLLLIPGHVIFIIAICFLENLGTPTPLFFVFYLLAALCQVCKPCK
jgi:hypothetical protein